MASQISGGQNINAVWKDTGNFDCRPNNNFMVPIGSRAAQVLSSMQLGIRLHGTGSKIFMRENKVHAGFKAVMKSVFLMFLFNGLFHMKNMDDGILHV